MQPSFIEGNRGRILCLHGFSGTPYELKPLSTRLGALDYTVSTPVLIGHGKTTQQLADSRWPDWLMSAKDAFDELSEGKYPVTVIGFSMGGLLALKLAHERGALVRGTAVLAPAYRINPLDELQLRVLRKIGVLPWLPALPKRNGPDISKADVRDSMPSHSHIPLSAAASILDGQREVESIVERILSPTWIFQGRGDHTVSKTSAQQLYEKLRCREKRLLFYPRSWHILTLDVEGDQVCQDVEGFIEMLHDEHREDQK